MSHDKEKVRADYRRAVQDLAGAFQGIEAALRACVACAYSIIGVRTLDVLDFKLDQKSLQRDALGALIRKFSNHFSAPALVKELELLTPIRNHVAHEALTLHVSDEPYDQHYMTAQRIRIQKSANEALACFTELIGRLETVSNSLHIELDKHELANRDQLDLLV